MNIDNSRPMARHWLNEFRSIESSQIWSTPELQCPSPHRYILRVACHPEHRNNTAGVAPNDGLRSQVGSPRSVGSAIVSRDEHCRNEALCLHAIIKRTFDLTDHLSDSRYHGGDPVPTCAPSDRPDQHNQPIMEHDPLAPKPM
jgi:hypothetical protein